MAVAITRDHGVIQDWARRHGACPLVLSRAGGMLRFEFDSAPAGALRDLDWEDFFRVFDSKGLELIYDDQPGSRAHKLAYPEAAPGVKRKPKLAARVKSHHPRKAA